MGERECTNCRFESLLIDEDPCDKCMDAAAHGIGPFAYWEPEQMCGTCKHEKTPYNLAPCQYCGDDGESKWEPKGPSGTKVEVKVEREIPKCCDCEHSDLFGGDEPCISCIPSLKQNFSEKAGEQMSRSDYEQGVNNPNLLGSDLEWSLDLLQEQFEGALHTMMSLEGVMVTPAVARALSLTRTKLQEAIFWLREAK